MPILAAIFEHLLPLAAVMGAEILPVRLVVGFLGRTNLLFVCVIVFLLLVADSLSALEITVLAQFSAAGVAASIVPISKIPSLIVFGL